MNPKCPHCGKGNLSVSYYPSDLQDGKEYTELCIDCHEHILIEIIPINLEIKVTALIKSPS